MRILSSIVFIRMLKIGIRSVSLKGILHRYFKIENTCSKGHLFYSAWPQRVALRQLRALFSSHHHFWRNAVLV